MVRWRSSSHKERGSRPVVGVIKVIEPVRKSTRNGSMRPVRSEEQIRNRSLKEMKRLPGAGKRLAEVGFVKRTTVFSVVGSANRRNSPTLGSGRPLRLAGSVAALRVAGKAASKARRVMGALTWFNSAPRARVHVRAHNIRMPRGKLMLHHKPRSLWIVLETGEVCTRMR